MNIALCYSGQIRNITECFTNHFHSFYEPNQLHNIFTYGFFWCDSEQELLTLDSWIRQHKIDYQISKTENTYIFKGPNLHIVATPQLNFLVKPEIQPDPRFPHSLFNMLSMYYSLAKCIELVPSNLINCVVRTRTDNYFLSPIGNLDGYDMKKLHVLNEKSHLDYALNDCFAFGSLDTMIKYSRLFQNFEHLVQIGAAVNSECLLGFNCLYGYQLLIEKHNWKFKFYRDL